MGNLERLLVLRNELEHGNADPARLYAVECAYNFKHSWLDMARSLVEVRNQNMYEKWGYTDFLNYCERELGLKRAVVDKLTASFYVLERVAPERLEAPAEDAPIPSCQSLDYYSRATGELRLDGNPSRDAPEQEMSPELSGQLYEAVFNERCSPKQLRDRFDPLIRPKPPAKEQLDVTRKALNSAHKLQELMEEVEGLSTETLRAGYDVLSKMEQEMELHLERLKEELAAAEEAQ